MTFHFPISRNTLKIIERITIVGIKCGEAAVFDTELSKSTFKLTVPELFFSPIMPPKKPMKVPIVF